MNYGFNYVPISARDPRMYRFGGLSGLPKLILRPDRNYKQFLPPVEYQNNGGFDRMDCVTRSAWDVIETLIYIKFGIRLNFSDRFTAKMSGTTREGNNFYDVAESIRARHGGVDESVYPDTNVSFAEYYKEIADEVIQLGKELFPRWEIKYEAVWDTVDSLWEALQYGPLQVGIYAYGPEVNGIQQRVETQGNHAVELMNAVYGEYWEIFDHYVRETRKLAWNTRFWGALRFDINKKTVTPVPMYAFKEDHMYFVAEGRGEEFAYIAGKLRHDDPNKMARQICYRTKGRIEDRYDTISLKELEGINAFDMKGNDLGPAKDLAL